MILRYKKGDLLTRIMTRNGKFAIVKYETLNDYITMPFAETAVSVPLIMIYTNDDDTQFIGQRETSVYISTTFTNDGIEDRIEPMGDLFIIGDKEETINKAKAHILFKHNTYFREHLRKK